MMRLVTILRMRLLSLFSRAKAEQDLDEELRYHLERQIEEGVAAGMSREDARLSALRTFQDLEQRKEECRDMRRLNLIDNLAQDFRYALRRAGKSPGFALLVVLVMAIGIGANTAVFSVVNGVLLKPLNYREPNRIVTLTTTWQSGGKLRNVALPDFQNWHDQSTGFSAMASYRSSDKPVKSASSSECVRVAMVSPDFSPGVRHRAQNRPVIQLGRGEVRRFRSGVD